MDGVINFLKPPGMSSNEAVIFLRKRLGVKKIGHAGTLDPGACGVLPICVGKATHISSYMMGSKKEYVAEVTFGKSTDTGDSYGNVIDASEAALPAREDVIRALAEFTGQITQQTPDYSAAKVEGRKRYQLARKGIEIPPQLRQVEIVETEYLSQTGEGAHLFRVVCGKGTYIRTLCEDIGKALNIPAYMSFLARTKCAGLNIENSVTADELNAGDTESALLPMDKFLGSLPRIDAQPEKRELLFHGGSVAFDGEDIEPVRIYAGGELMGIGCVRQKMAKITTRLVDM